MHHENKPFFESIVKIFIRPAFQRFFRIALALLLAASVFYDWIVLDLFQRVMAVMIVALAIWLPFFPVNTERDAFVKHLRSMPVRVVPIMTLLGSAITAYSGKWFVSGLLFGLSVMIICLILEAKKAA